MASGSKKVETLKHDAASRKNIPTAEFESVLDPVDQEPIRVAFERRNRDLDPQLVWRGKDVPGPAELMMQAPPLFIQEKVHPKVLIDDLERRTQQRRAEGENGNGQPDLFADFNGLPSDDARTEFYQHEGNWSNRMILGDSLQVMASLAEREGLRGKVQCIVRKTYKTGVKVTDAQMRELRITPDSSLPQMELHHRTDQGKRMRGRRHEGRPPDVSPSDQVAGRPVSRVTTAARSSIRCAALMAVVPVSATSV